MENAISHVDHAANIGGPKIGYAKLEKPRRLGACEERIAELLDFASEVLAKATAIKERLVGESPSDTRKDIQASSPAGQIDRIGAKISKLSEVLKDIDSEICQIDNI